MADDRDSDEESSSIGFSLPPITLPPILTEGLRWKIPGALLPPTVNRRQAAIVGAGVLDLLDAMIALWGVPGTALVRTVAGTILGIGLVGITGVGYAWETLAVLGGQPSLTVAPSFLLLVLVRRWRKHPEDLQ